jgi:SAM-dependent methyltransferase
VIAKDFRPGIYEPHYFVRRRLLEAITDMAPRLKGKLLDFGCGQKPYRSLFTVDEYIGLDFENPGHSHLNESIDVFYDGNTIPFGENSFDSVFSSEVFEHVFNLPQILPEINRVLKPGGQLLFTCPFAFCEHEQPNDFARYTSFAVKDMMVKNGFEIVEQRKTGNSVEAICQLQLMYLHQHIYPSLKKIPIIRSAFRLFVYTATNVTAKVLSRLAPKGMDLYMNNVVLCRKVKQAAV